VPEEIKKRRKNALSAQVRSLFAATQVFSDFLKQYCKH